MNRWRKKLAYAISFVPLALILGGCIVPFIGMFVGWNLPKLLITYALASCLIYGMCLLSILGEGE